LHPKKATWNDDNDKSFKPGRGGEYITVKAVKKEIIIIIYYYSSD